MQIVSGLALGLLGKTERPLRALRSLRKQGVDGLLPELWATQVH